MPKRRKLHTLSCSVCKSPHRAAWSIRNGTKFEIGAIIETANQNNIWRDIVSLASRIKMILMHVPASQVICMCALAWAWITLSQSECMERDVASLASRFKMKQNTFCWSVHMAWPGHKWCSQVGGVPGSHQATFEAIIPSGTHTYWQKYWALMTENSFGQFSESSIETVKPKQFQIWQLQRQKWCFFLSVKTDNMRGGWWPCESESNQPKDPWKLNNLHRKCWHKSKVVCSWVSDYFGMCNGGNISSKALSRCHSFPSDETWHFLFKFIAMEWWLCICLPELTCLWWSPTTTKECFKPGSVVSQKKGQKFYSHQNKEIFLSKGMWIFPRYWPLCQ